LTVACVFRTGGDFVERDVRDLMHGILDHLATPYQSVCLTDRGTPYLNNTVNKVIRLEHSWPGWWGKMELFRLPGPLLYFDLDTRIIKDIGMLAAAVCALAENRLMMLRGFYKNDICSGIMGWNGDVSWLHDKFGVETSHISAEFRNFRGGVSFGSQLGYFRGDQDYIAARLNDKEHGQVLYAQDLMGGIYSYKVHIRDKAMPADTRVICFHGKPRPVEVGL